MTGVVFLLFSQSSELLCHLQWSTLVEGTSPKGHLRTSLQFSFLHLGLPKWMLLCQEAHHSVKLHCIISPFEFICHSAGEYRGDSRERVCPGRSPASKLPPVPDPSWQSQECQLREGVSGHVCISVVSCTFNENSWIVWAIEWGEKCKNNELQALIQLTTAA